MPSQKETLIDMDIILETLLNSKKFGEYIRDVKGNKFPIMLSGLTSVAKVQMMSATQLFSKNSLIYVVSNELEAQKALNDFKYFNKEALYFPKRDIKNFDTFAESKDNLFERIEVDLHERTYHLEDYLSFLHTAGFSREKIRVTVDYGETGYTVQDHAETARWFFRVEK